MRAHQRAQVHVGQAIGVVHDETTAAAKARGDLSDPPARPEDPLLERVLDPVESETRPVPEGRSHVIGHVVQVDDRVRHAAARGRDILRFSSLSISR